MRCVVFTMLVLVAYHCGYAQDVVHIVDKGESLSLIALNYTQDSTHSSQIAEYNKIKNPALLAEGMKITIPQQILKKTARFKTPDGLTFKEYYAIGERSAGLGNYFKAEGYFYTTFVIEKNPATFFNYLLACFKQEKYDFVLSEYGATTYRSAKLSYLIGLTYEAQGAIDRAVDKYRESIAYEPRYFLPYKALSAVYKKMNRGTDADAVMQSFREQMK